MNNEKLLDIIGQVKDEFIEEAAPNGMLNNDVSKVKSVKTSKAKIYQFAKWGALAACLCLIVGLGMKMNLFSATSKADNAFDASVHMNQSAEMEHGSEEGKENYKFGTGMYQTDTGFTNGDYSASEEDYVTTTETSTADTSVPDWGLSLSVNNVSSTGLTLVVTQSGGNPTGSLQTGEAYRLTTLVDGTWQTVEELPLPEGVDGRAFNSLAYFIPMEGTKEFDINWNWIFGELPSGTYRLIKEFINFRETANYDSCEYWVEFHIE